MLQCVAVCCSVAFKVAAPCVGDECIAVYGSVLQCMAVRCSALQCVAVFCGVAVCDIVTDHILLCNWRSPWFFLSYERDTARVETGRI